MSLLKKGRRREGFPTTALTDPSEIGDVLWMHTGGVTTPDDRPQNWPEPSETQCDISIGGRHM